MSIVATSSAERARREGVDFLRAGLFHEAAGAFVHGEEIASNEADAALFRIHRASIPILRREESALTALLPSILLRRYGSHHAFLAAHYLSVFARDHGDHRRARRYSEIALKAAEESGDAYYEAIAYDEAASTAALGGAYAEACRLSENACAVLDTYCGSEPPELVRGMIVHNLGYAQLAQRNYEAALVAFHTGVEILQAIGSEWCLENAEINIAVACLGLDRIDEAERQVERAASRLDPSDREFRYVHYLRGEIAHRRGRFEIARAHFTQLQAFYPQFESLPDLLLAIDLLPLLLPE